MTSEPASLSNQGQDADREDRPDAVKIPLKQTGLDIASQMRSVKEAEPDLVRAVGDYSTSVKQTLGVIEAIEETLQHKRKQIDEIQARQAVLAREYRELGQTLELATRDLARQFTGIIRGLEMDASILAPAATPSAESTPAPATTAPQPTATPPAQSNVEPTAEAITKTILETGAADAEPPTRSTADQAFGGATEQPSGAAADQAAKSEDTSILDLDTSNLPPVPEFLGDRPKVPGAKGDGSSEDSSSGPLGWWRHGKK
jgi:hypothetical protein